MRKGSANFKDVRNRVAQPFNNAENIPLNPLNKISFQAIKKLDPRPLL